MTAGERFIESAPLKEHFHDAHERRAYYRILEIAKQIVDDPSLLDRGRAFLDRFVRGDPRQQQGYDLWIETLRLNSEQVARLLIADDEKGARLRDTAPVFRAIPTELARLISNRAG